jgi:hypothetical protein
VIQIYKTEQIYKQIVGILTNAKLPRNEVIKIAEDIRNNVFIDIISDEVEERVKK